METILLSDRGVSIVGQFSVVDPVIVRPVVMLPSVGELAEPHAVVAAHQQRIATWLRGGGDSGRLDVDR